MILAIVAGLWLIQTAVAVDLETSSRRVGTNKEARKLFGGYKITPRFCQPTRKVENSPGGPNICMFNHECAQRNGQVVGACMDGFLFGACCQLPAGVVGELMESDLHAVSHSDNKLHGVHVSPTRPPGILSTRWPGISSTRSPSTARPIIFMQSSTDPWKQEVLPTAQENTVVQIGGVQFKPSGVTLPSSSPETFIVNHENEIDPNEFYKPSRKTTMRMESTTSAYRPSAPFIQISISNTPGYSTAKPLFYERPSARPKPSKPTTDNFILVPTITHTAKPNRTELDPIATIIQMLNNTGTTNPYAGTYTYQFVSTNDPSTSSTKKKPPSTSYVYSSSPLPPRPTTRPLTTKKKTTKPTKKTTTTSQYFYPSTTNEYIYSRPTGHSTFAYSPEAFVTLANKPSSSKRPTSTANTVSSSYTVYPISPLSSIYTPAYPSSPSYSSTPPTIIILGPSTPSPSTPFPVSPSTAVITQVPNKVLNITINNHLGHLIPSTANPSPTILITPKPSSSTPKPIRVTTEDYYTSGVEGETSVNDMVNFPPVRNPNLNISTLDDDVTTPGFLEDEALRIKMESFVNKIVESLQEPFHGLKKVVYNQNNTGFTETTLTRPTKKPSKTGTKPASTLKTTKRPSSRRPTTSSSRPRPTTTTRRTTPTRRATTTPPTYIEPEVPAALGSDYRKACGLRPLTKTGRIVGGKASTFGDFPWQVLIRESTWLGLFTKNKCGGVLISNKFVMTAAHCQPGFLASLVAVLGEHDISGEKEIKRTITRNVKRVIVHRQYDAATFENDLALLELEHPIQFDEHIIPICLPREGEDFTGRMATVTGWGRLKYGGGIPQLLQEVQVPIMENQVCQEMFRTAGHNKVIKESFVCAGYANGQKDSCEGDSGGPLVLQRPDGRYQLAGTVSHGIKCAAPYMPGVYMRTAYYKPWIESITGVH